ncbi:MAG: hypothetical protein KatS3mg060_3590 [Dehalococcoidia bacterium]|nr:MAG: hypothetical protein KatS3mg060_3590 [Dehalococcoidia bacterium]
MRDCDRWRDSRCPRVGSGLADVSRRRRAALRRSAAGWGEKGSTIGEAMNRLAEGNPNLADRKTLWQNRRTENTHDAKDWQASGSRAYAGDGQSRAWQRQARGNSPARMDHLGLIKAHSTPPGFGGAGPFGYRPGQGCRTVASGNQLVNPSLKVVVRSPVLGS